MGESRRAPDAAAAASAPADLHARRTAESRGAELDAGCRDPAPADLDAAGAAARPSTPATILPGCAG